MQVEIKVRKKKKEIESQVNNKVLHLIMVSFKVTPLNDSLKVTVYK